jgi:anti-sigma-K factor RskA
MAEVLNDDEAVTIQLDGSLVGLRLVSSDRENAAVLMGSGLQRPDSGSVFQLWAIHDEQKIGMGTFMPAATGEVALVVEGAGGDSEWAVTIEPEGGSDQPTSDPVAVSPGLQ